MAASYNSWKEDVFTWARRCRLQMDLRNAITRRRRLRGKLEHLDGRIRYLNMNLPERIPHIIGLLSRAWAAHPEWRLGQLVSNIMGPGPQDVFHLSDAGLEAGLHSILGPNTEGTAAPSDQKKTGIALLTEVENAAQLPQSKPDAPPVQRWVRTEAEDELIEGVIRWYEDPGNADKERAAMYFAKRVAKERIRFAKDDARAQKRRHHPMFGRKKDAPRPVMGIPKTTSVLPRSSQPTSRSEEGKVPAQEDVTIPQKALAHKGEGE